MSARKEVPTHTINPFGLRMPPELHKLVAAEAAANGRSMNSEIVARLEDTGNEPRGKTLRDEFAMAALVSMGFPKGPDWSAEPIARRAYAIADAMLAARQKGGA